MNVSNGRCRTETTVLVLHRSPQLLYNMDPLSFSGQCFTKMGYTFKSILNPQGLMWRWSNLCSYNSFKSSGKADQSHSESLLGRNIKWSNKMWVYEPQSISSEHNCCDTVKPLMSINESIHWLCPLILHPVQGALAFLIGWIVALFERLVFSGLKLFNDPLIF